MNKIYQQIKIEQLEARKAKLKLHTNLYTTLLGEIQNSVLGTTTSTTEVTDSAALQVINKFIKNAKETLKLQPNNVDVSIELKLLETFVPQKLSNEELIEVILKLSKDIPEGLPQNAKLGKIMGLLKTQYENLYEGAVAKDLILNNL